MKKDILSLLDLEKQDFEHLFKRAIKLKERYGKGIFDSVLTGKTLGLIFDKKSNSTRGIFPIIFMCFYKRLLKNKDGNKSLYLACLQCTKKKTQNTYEKHWLIIKN